VICEVVNGGALGEHKGINLPGVKLRVPAMTAERPRGPAVRAQARRELHRRECLYGARRRAAREAADPAGGERYASDRETGKAEAIEKLDEILHVADGVMVARGDLGVEMSPERVPVVQKTIITRAREFRKPGDYRHADAGDR